MKETAQHLNWELKNTKLDLGYTQEEYRQLKEQYEVTIHPVANSEVVKGTVIGINKHDLIINTGDKSDGIVALSEFRDQPNIKIGDQVEVYVEERENKKGQLVLSRKKAKLVKGWERIQDSATNGTILEASVKRRTKGGLIADLEGVEVFLPGSQIDIKPVADFDFFLEKTLDVIVIKINPLTDNVIVSHKAVIEKGLESQKVDIINKLEKGQIVEGVVRNLTKFGAFIELGGITGLMHITDIAWERISHPEEYLTLGQKIQVVVTDFDEEKKRVSLGMKQLTPNPWDELPESLQVGTKVKGKIVNVTDYGAFLEFKPGVEGLIHISSLSWSPYPKSIEEMLHVGDEVEAIVLKLNKDEKKMSLGIKQLTPDPWEREGLEQRYAVGTKHRATVINISHFGALVELEEDIYSLLRISDLSWTKKINHPSDLFKVGDSLELVVLEFDKENRKLSLSLKHLIENPWEVYESDFQIGSVHPGTIIKKSEKGTFVQLPHGLEGVIPSRYSIKENGQELAPNEQLDVEVIDFSKTAKRIVLSQVDSLKSANKPYVKREQPPRPTGNFITAEKTTLGDIKELATLKKQLEANQDDIALPASGKKKPKSPASDTNTSSL
jgi:small subunit ribosomal protein S1